jgi:hypothetical protein
MRGVAHRRRQRVEHDCDHRREVADAKQHHDRDQIDERRERLERVDGGLDHAPEPRPGRGRDAERDADQASEHHGDGGQVDRQGGVLPLARDEGEKWKSDTQQGKARAAEPEPGQAEQKDGPGPRLRQEKALDRDHDVQNNRVLERL